MARPERQLVRDGTPVRELAFWLRDVRSGAGLTYAQLATRSGYSVSTLQEAAAGRRLPTLAVTLAFAQACGGGQDAWKGYWSEVRRAVETGADTVAPPPWAPPWGTVAPPGEPGPPRPAPRPRASRTARVAAALTLVALAAAGVSARLWLTESHQPPGHRDFASVVVQNKVAVGRNTLAEDRSPAYLSTKTVPFCARRGCKLPGTEMWSGARLVVSCWTRGERLTNKDVTSEGVEANTGGATSDLWYAAKWKDGRTGYLSEIYVTPEGRGGVGLARCSGEK